MHRAPREQQIHALVMEALIRPIDEIIANWERHLAGTALMRGFIAALLNFHSLGYDSKAHLNQSIAHLFELQVRASNVAAKRHPWRSGRFFDGMLAAQLGVIVATFALAVQRRTLLWSMAAVACALPLLVHSSRSLYV